MSKNAAILTFSDAAKSHIQSAVKKAGGGHFRLWIKTTGCSGFMYMPEIVPEPQASDIEVGEIEGAKIYLEASAVDIIQGTKVDFVKKMMGFAQLEFDNPNATGLCGCGEALN